MRVPMRSAMVAEAMRVLLLVCPVGGKIAARAAACVLRLCQQLSSSHGGHPRTAAVFLLVVQVGARLVRRDGPCKAPEFCQRKQCASRAFSRRLGWRGKGASAVCNRTNRISPVTL